MMKGMHENGRGREGVVRPRRPRLGVTGSAGIGKTTLVRGAAEAFGVPVIAEAMRTRLEAGLELHRLSREEHRDLLADSVTQSHRQAASAVAETGGFVADRIPLDFVAFWLCNGYGFDDEAATEDLVRAARTAIETYDLIVVLPWGVIPLVADGIRSANAWMQLHFQTVIEGLCRRYVPSERLVFMPPDVMRPEDRLAWLRDRVTTSVG